MKTCVAFLAMFICSWILSAGDAQEPGHDLSWLSETEREWLLEHPTIRVAPTPDYPPFEFWNEDGQFDGIVKNYLEHFEQVLGIRFQIVKTRNWAENLEFLKNKEVDAVSLIVPWTDRDFVKVSQAYVSYPAMIFVRREQGRNLTLYDLAGMKVAVPNDYTGESFLRVSYPEIKVVEVEGPEEGVRLLSEGKVDALFEGSSVVAFLAKKDGIDNIRIAGESDFFYSNGFGVRSDWEAFATIMSKTIARVKPAQHREFSAAWATGDFFEKRFYENEQFWWTIVSILAAMVVGIGAVLFWNRKQAAFIDQLELAQQKAELANRQLDDARLEAEAANDAKSSFVAHISHEIRTPMHGVLGMCELLRGTELDQQQHEYLDFATDSAENLLGLINEILDISKIEAGKLELEEQSFSIDDVVESVVGLMQIQAEPKRLRLIQERDEKIGKYYLGDADRIRQILLNLVNNAIKFTAQGTVTIRVQRLDSSTSASQSSKELIRFEVADTGVGVAADKLDRIFQAYEQENKSTTRQYGGTGLGLAICKKLAEMMGGTADARSVVGQGSVFGFTALLKPTNTPPNALASPQDDEDVQPRRVLLAEDGVVNQTVAVRLLEKRGHKVQVVETGQQALDAIEKDPYDVVLMDIQMPVMDGLTAIRILRERESESGRHQWVVALTAHAMSGDKERFLRAGMDDNLTKPFKPHELYASVERVTKNNESTDRS